MVCSSGGSGTPLGDFSLDGWYRWEWLGLVGGVSGQYCTQIYGDYLFHSTLYREGTFIHKDNRLGMHLSAGCVRLDISNAKWIYDNIPSRSTVVVY